MDSPYEHIACCIEDSDASRAALAEARRLRALGPGRLTLVHVAPSPVIYGEGLGPPPEDEISAAASRWLTELAASVDGAERVLLSGHPGAAVCDWAGRAGPDLLVAAAHRGLVQRLALGSFAGYLAYHAPCAVLVVRP
jgi:nucleotide-binding universal stress UspA family protein